jgi:hypothetical protein
MPVHDWNRVDAGIFHAFHHDWITEISRALNRGLLPAEYYALPEQFAAGFGPDVLTLQEQDNSESPPSPGLVPGVGGGLRLAPPKLKPVAETDMAFYRRKQKSVTVRHVSGDRIVAMVELVSPGNKASRNQIRSFVQKAAQLLEHGIHLLVVDLFPPGPRDPQGIHGAIWEEVTGQEYALPTDNPLTLASYECGLALRAYVVHFAVGSALADMPLFLEPDQAIDVPLEATYNATFAEVPARWRRVLEAPG